MEASRNDDDRQPKDGDARPAVPLVTLRRLLRATPAPDREPRVDPVASPRAERCELCGAAIPTEHRHLLERSTRALLCACAACALLFERVGAAGGKYLATPQRALALSDFAMSDEQWDELMIPVGMAFIFLSGEPARPVAYYPSPAGPMQSLLALESWAALLARNPILATLAPEVEALLVNRVGGAREHYLVPIDRCYELVGLIRSSWRGLSGGQEVWEAIAAFFAALRASARVYSPTQAHAGAPNLERSAGCRT